MGYNALKMGSIAFQHIITMARIYPDQIPSDTQSNAERKLYNLLRDRLSHDYVVFHSVRWLTRNPNTESGPTGEADFVVTHPNHGLLVIEVKGGGIRIENGWWYSIDAANEKHRLKKDPVKQAENSVYALKDHLKHNELTRHFSYPIFHAVAFPDIVLDEKQRLRPDIPRTLIIDRSALSDLSKTIESIFVYWHSRYNYSSPGSNAIKALTQLLAPTIEIRTKIAHIFEEEDEQIKRLTESQFGVLRALQMFRRAAIIGGAGTGKTMLAVEKARNLAQSGFKVLLLCYNVNLAKWLSSITSDIELISVKNFHELARLAAEDWVDMRGVTSQPDFNDKAEHVLCDVLEKVKHDPKKVARHLFDAVIVDEAQDFNSDYWIPISDLLKDPATGVFYVFFDDNQRIFAQLSHIPISKEQEPLVLSDNCRNTQSIYELLKQYTPSSIETRCIGPAGRPIEIIPASSDAEALKALRTLLHELVVERGALASQIVILTPRKELNSQWKNGLRLGNFTLRWDAFASDKSSIRVSTIQSFKGLESPIVILTEMEHAFSEKREQLAYVGISRARNHLIIIGKMPESEESRN